MIPTIQYVKHRTCHAYTDEQCFKVQIKHKGWAKGRKRRFKKRLCEVLEYSDFLLLHVPADGTRMKLVKPASDLYHRNRIIQRINQSELVPSTWYAISHLWNIPKTNQYLWDDISRYVEDEDGHPMKPVPMRVEKRKTLLELLESRPDSYWWIDILCARSNDFPFDILGHIFACCTQCVAMIDCDPHIIPQMNAMWDIDPDGKDRPFTEFLDQYEQLNHHIRLLTQCIWWRRVWMWQETVLPQDVLLMAETATQVSSEHMLHVDDLYHFEAKLGKMLYLFMHHGKVHKIYACEKR